MYWHGRFSCIRVSMLLLTFLGGDVSQTRLDSCYLGGSFWSRFWRVTSDAWLKKRYFPLYIATGSNKVYRRSGEEVKCLVFIYYSMVLTPSNFRNKWTLNEPVSECWTLPIMTSCFSIDPSCPPSNYTLRSSHDMYAWNHSYPVQNCASENLPFPGLNPENKRSSAEDNWGNARCDPRWRNFCRVLQTLGQRPNWRSEDNGADGTWRPRRGGFLDPASRILQRPELVEPTVDQMDAP